jgi:hypothetical protein
VEPNSRENMIPLLSVRSTKFEQDLALMRRILDQFEERAHVKNGYKFSERAEMAAGWWFYDVYVTPEFLQRLFNLALPKEEFRSNDKKSAVNRLVGMFSDQIKKNGSEARIKMFGDIPFAAPWWAWLMK